MARSLVSRKDDGKPHSWVIEVPFSPFDKCGSYVVVGAVGYECMGVRGHSGPHVYLLKWDNKEEDV